MSRPELSIIIPNYRTSELTCLCLRLLRLNTDLERVRVIVVDNASGDASLDYLRKVEWIELIERTDTGDEPGFVMHARALDLAFERVDTPFVLIMHTDTLVRNDLWLDYLLDQIKADERIAGVGSWKLETVSRRKYIGKKIEDFFRGLLGRRSRDERFLRSHCALFRSDAIRKYTNGFYDGETAGLSIYRHLTAAGFEMKFLPSIELGKFLTHLNHATMILNPETGGRKTSRPSARRRLDSRLDLALYHEILEREDLDKRP